MTEATKLTPTARERHELARRVAEPLAPDAVDEGAEQRHPEDDRDERVVVRGEEREHGPWIPFL